MDHHQVLLEIIKEDVERGFALPLPVETLQHIPHASLAPLGCVKQLTLDAAGNKVIKHRMTHDQSFPGPSSLSVNLRVQQEKLPLIMYSFVLLRSIHYILDIRRCHPTKKIFICKFDIDAAYRHCSFSSKTAFKSLTIFSGLLLVALRMTFGGAPCPSMWGVISETITDIGNAQLQNKFWDHSDLYGSVSDQIATPLSLPESVPFHQSKDLSIQVPPNDKGKVDIYTDDLIGIAPDIEDAPTRIVFAIPLAIRTLSRPNSDLDVIPRKDIISLKKLCAEGQLSEVKTVLGWTLNTRSLTISLPEYKVMDWLREIDTICLAKRVHFKTLESMLGRFNHVAYMLQPMHHFMGRLYRALLRAKARAGWTVLSSNELSDLNIHSEFLHYAKRGISLNNIAFRKPTSIYRLDASEFGLGGYNIITGRAWHWELPINLRLRTSINSLEFISSVINIWIDITLGLIQPEDCILSQTDSSSAARWLRKSNFTDAKDEEIQLNTARKLATILIDSQSCIYSQWFSGNINNNISDSLSRDFHLSDSYLVSELSSTFPDQVPFGLQIHPLPTEISSWVTSVLLLCPQTAQWLKEPTRSSFALGTDTKNTSSPSESRTTHTWKPLIEVNDIKYLAPLLSQSEKVDLVLSLPNFSRPTQSEPPWIAWHRPTGWPTEQIHGWMQMESLLSFYSLSSEDIDPLTQEKSHKWQSQVQF
jgi:hypothetical protein